MRMKKVHLLGYGSALAGAGIDKGEGPLALKNSSFIHSLIQEGVDLEWQDILEPQVDQPKLSAIADLSQKLARNVSNLVTQQQFFTVLGGDHSSGIGTWSGAYHALKDQGQLGLIWVDAHMDSHTLDSSGTGNIHGMPVASLLGHGASSLTSILNKEPKIKPENLCLIGIRSFEEPEAALLKKLNVRVFFMDEILQKGLSVVMEEAIALVKQNTVAFGISIDIDSMDPNDAPATGVAEPGGLRAKDLCESLKIVVKEPKLIGAEIVEFDPSRDQDRKTEKLISHLLKILASGTI